MREPVETQEYKGYKVSIYQDENPINPITDWDMLGTFRCFHRHYDLSNTKDFDSPEALIEHTKSDNIISLPLYLYDHSGITISTSNANYPFNDRWDAGQVGFIYVSKDKVKKEYGWTTLNKKRINTILEVLRNEVKAFDDYLTGNVYGYVVSSDEDENIDSCWGFFGDTKYAMEEGLDIAKRIAEQKEEQLKIGTFGRLEYLCV